LGELRKPGIMKREHKPAQITKYLAVSPVPPPSAYEASRPRQFFGPVDGLPYAASSGTTSTCSNPSYIFQDAITSPPTVLFSSATSALPSATSVQPTSHYDQHPSAVATLDTQSSTSPEKDQPSTIFPQRENLHRITEESSHQNPSLNTESPLKRTTKHATLSTMAHADSASKILRRVRSNLTEIESLKRRRGLVANMDIPNRIM
jgi:hypothetical protein